MLQIPSFMRNYLNVDEIRNSINDAFKQMPSYARMLLHSYARVIQGATIVIGHIQTMNDLYDMIQKLEAVTDEELSEKQVEKLEAQTKDILGDEYSSIESADGQQDGIDPIQEAFIRRNTYYDI